MKHSWCPGSVISGCDSLEAFATGCSHGSAVKDLEAGVLKLIVALLVGL